MDRKVVGFMSSSQQEPDLLCFVFVLETSPLLQKIDEAGERARRTLPCSSVGGRRLTRRSLREARMGQGSSPTLLVKN